MIRILLLLLLSSWISLRTRAQTTQIFAPNVHTVQWVVDNNPLLPPFLEKDKHQHIALSWDELSHDYHRYYYHIVHCDAQWNPSEDLYESDFLNGLNDQPIEDYEKSFNTTQLYTHYRVRFPNPETSMRLSGNYRVIIYEEGDTHEDPVIEARFSIYERAMHILPEVTTDTDIDVNKHHQQVALQLSYGDLMVANPDEQLTVVVFQNRRWENRVVNPRYTLRTHQGLVYRNCRDLIFPAGNEFYKFEILDLNSASMGVDYISWEDAYYHAILFPHKTEKSYVYDQDQNGVYVLRSRDDIDDATTAEYVQVHFQFVSPRIPDTELFVTGQWAHGILNRRYLMHYDEQNGMYHANLLLKQGYYSYQIVQADGSTSHTMGDFYQTENEYITLVYYRLPGSRTDRLVGYSCVHTSFQ